jgi:hypothetical protein
MRLSVVDNRYRGEGFAFIIRDLPYGDRWKYKIHKDYCAGKIEDTDARALVDSLNAEFKALDELADNDTSTWVSSGYWPSC